MSGRRLWNDYGACGLEDHDTLLLGSQQHRMVAYLTAFGVFRRPPWKELSCRLQTVFARAQQEHGFCVKHGVCG